jgi:hypothetical protein
MRVLHRWPVRAQIAREDSLGVTAARPESCEGGHRTVYAGRRKADVVMASVRESMQSTSTDRRNRTVASEVGQCGRGLRLAIQPAVDLEAEAAQDN